VRQVGQLRLDDLVTLATTAVWRVTGAGFVLLKLSRRSPTLQGEGQTLAGVEVLRFSVVGEVLRVQKWGFYRIRMEWKRFIWEYAGLCTGRPGRDPLLMTRSTEAIVCLWPSLRWQIFSTCCKELHVDQRTVEQGFLGLLSKSFILMVMPGRLCRLLSVHEWITIDVAL